MFEMLMTVLIIGGCVMIGGLMGCMFQGDGRSFWTGAFIGALIYGFGMILFFACINSAL